MERLKRAPFFPLLNGDGQGQESAHWFNLTAVPERRVPVPIRGKFMLYREYKYIILAAILCIIFNLAVRAQTSEFTFQGKLTDQSIAANGLYDISFKLYDAANLQVGTTVAREDVQVTNGVFTVSLDFGAAAFDGGSRSIEISIRP